MLYIKYAGKSLNSASEVQTVCSKVINDPESQVLNVICTASYYATHTGTWPNPGDCSTQIDNEIYVGCAKVCLTLGCAMLRLRYHA
jgi:hypothetical protein